MSATIETRTLPIVVASGNARELGRIQGEELREMIAEVVVRWEASLASRHSMSAEAYIAEFLAATHFIPTIERYAPNLLDEVRGIAEGAGLPFASMLAYNLMDEEWSYGSERLAQAPGCTVACLQRPGEPPVVAQTMDIPSLHDGSQVVIHHKPDDGVEALVFTGAGMLGLNGANAAGVGVVVNNLAMLPSSRNGLPVMFVLRGILERTSLDDAVAFVERVPHAIGQHYAIGSPEGIAGLEGAANGVTRVPIETDRYVHANHPLANLAVVGDPTERYASSRTFERHNRAVELIDGAGDLAGIESLLSDEVTPISCAPRRGFMTFGGTSISCSVPPVMHVTAGPPHQTEWVPVGF
jgi:predicted choloylglycine hydrolase